MISNACDAKVCPQSDVTMAEDGTRVYAEPLVGFCPNTTENYFSSLASNHSCGLMTIAIGINFGTYILLAADTRTTYYDWSGQVINHFDESVKIQKTTMGLITGAGSKQLLDPVKVRLKEEEIIHTDQIKQIIRGERLKYLRRYKRTAAHHIELTGWLFTYVTVEDDNPKLRLGMFHPSLGDDLALYEENYPAAINPHEVTEETADIIIDFLKKKIRPVNKFTELQDSIQYHWSIIATLIQKIQPMFPSISSYSQIGVHTLEGLTGISPILKKAESKVSITLSSR